MQGYTRGIVDRIPIIGTRCREPGVEQPALEESGGGEPRVEESGGGEPRVDELGVEKPGLEDLQQRCSPPSGPSLGHPGNYTVYKCSLINEIYIGFFSFCLCYVATIL